jgi:lipoate-protein ligase B
MSKSPQTVRARWLGSVAYRDAWELQGALVQAVREGAEPETLLLLEHPHVFTLGRRASIDHVLWTEALRRERQVDLVACDRGGDATYHGPGQLVGYPILDLRRHGGDILGYLRQLEESLISYLASLGVVAGRIDGLTGVWCDGEKIAAVGVKLTDTVVSHGFALNLTTDLGYFDGIVPCGLHDRRPTSLLALTHAAVDVEQAARAYACFFARAFGVAVEWTAAPTYELAAETG